MFKETSLACLFDIGSLIGGFMIALQLDIFHLSPWAIALYPAVISIKGVITGVLTGRLSTALHLGTIYPKFLGNTKSFYRLISATIVLTLATSVTISLVSILFGTLFWGVTLTELPAILTVMVATLSVSLLIALITIKGTFISFKKSLDPDIIVYPATATATNIIITLLYIAVLNLYFSGPTGQWAIIIFGLINVFLVALVLPKNIKETEFRSIIKEALPTMILIAFIVNVTGTLLKGISNIAGDRREIYTLYPAIIDVIGDAGLVVSSAATMKLTLGILSPTFSSIKHHAKNIFSAWTSSLIFFVVLGVLSLMINSIFAFDSIMNLLTLLVIANIIAFAANVIISYGISILSFKRGLDPDNFVIPIGNSIADALTTLAIFITMLFII
ncbi:MAG: magnesium transporter [Candidatus Bathyarchaeota archaeon]|nr:magnesium transporter [Candidatus Bathyarchaeota archaeon]MDD4324904.1 magnesium transporter [Candidatus Bathyarchaeota archaeon]MDI9578549.1 magnesium transporter [Thermoproteota archaeon]MDT8781775.1 magnesium transporter [Candidatus Bathyarchaeota archaeon]NLD66132.1 hypothetical protein [Thermoproteota archaeon]